MTFKVCKFTLFMYCPSILLWCVQHAKLRHRAIIRFLIDQIEWTAPSLGHRNKHGRNSKGRESSCQLATTPVAIFVMPAEYYGAPWRHEKSDLREWSWSTVIGIKMGGIEKDMKVWKQWLAPICYYIDCNLCHTCGWCGKVECAMKANRQSRHEKLDLINIIMS